MGDVTWISIEEALQGFFVTPEELSRAVENIELDAKYEDDGERQFLRLMEHQVAAKYERRSHKLNMSKELYGLAAGVTASLVAAGIYDLGKAISVQREDDRAETQAVDGRVIVLLADDDIEFSELIESGQVDFNEFHRGEIPSIEVFTVTEADQIIDYAVEVFQKTMAYGHTFIIFCDLKWAGGVIGPEKILEIKNNEFLETAFVIAHSHSSDPELVNQCYEVGANIYLSKSSLYESERHFYNFLRHLLSDGLHFPTQRY